MEGRRWINIAFDEEKGEMIFTRGDHNIILGDFLCGENRVHLLTLTRHGENMLARMLFKNLTAEE